MPNFTARIELHGAKTSEDYENLHREMENKGFSRDITDSKGVSYRLPTAEYNYVGQRTIEQVLEMAKSAASKVKADFEAIVTESNGRRWYNLHIQ